MGLQTHEGGEMRMAGGPCEGWSVEDVLEDACRHGGGGLPAVARYCGGGEGGGTVGERRKGDQGQADRG